MRPVVITVLMMLFSQLAEPIEVWQRLAIGGPDAADNTGWVWKGIPCPAGATPAPMTGVDPFISSTQPAYANLCYWPNTIEFPITDLLPGTYLVKLLVMDPQVNDSGTRLMDIYVNGQLIYNRYDIAAQAGGVLKPWSIGFPVYATEGKIVIRLANQSPTVSGFRRNAMVSGIEINVLRDGNLLPAGSYSTQRRVPESFTSLHCEQGDWSASKDGTKLYVCVDEHFRRFTSDAEPWQ